MGINFCWDTYWFDLIGIEKNLFWNLKFGAFVFSVIISLWIWIFVKDLGFNILDVHYSCCIEILLSYYWEFLWKETETSIFGWFFGRVKILQIYKYFLYPWFSIEASDLLQKLSLDGQPKTLEIPEPTKKVIFSTDFVTYVFGIIYDFL